MAVTCHKYWFIVSVSVTLFINDINIPLECVCPIRMMVRGERERYKYCAPATPMCI